jgi:hypothetical protein
MHVIGVGTNNVRVVTASCEELLMIKGQLGAVVAGMFASGSQIDVATQFALLTASIGREAKLKKLAEDMEKAAADIKKGLEKP